MNISIKQLTDAIEIKVGNEKLRVAEDTNDWRQERITEFLISAASETPQGEKLSLEPKELKDDSKITDTFKHVWELFKAFVDKYNESCEDITSD